MVLQVLSYPGNPRAWKSIIAGKFVGVQVDYPSTFQFGVDNKNAEFLNKNPNGKVPVLETDGGCVFESNSMARYVARLGANNLYGRNPVEAALVDAWMDWAITTLESPAMTWAAQIKGYMPYNKKEVDVAKVNLKSALTILENHLLHNTYVVGERVTLADIVLAMTLLWPFQFVMDPQYRAPFVNIDRWFQTLINKKNFKEVIGEVAFCPQEAQPPKKEAAPQPKKEEKKEAPKKPEAKDDDGEDEDEFKEKPKKSKLDELPKAKMALDEFKRQYSNTDTRTAALPWLWNNYDSEGYCWFVCKYKYNHETQAVFQTSNLIAGFFQRLEKLHKYAFGSMAITGFAEAGKQEVSGVWMFRGKEIPDEMKECDDYELYEWSQLNTEDSATRELINDYLAWDKPIDGKAFIDGKIFK